jgi:cobyrinic acid a,c-diamide synthase
MHHEAATGRPSINLDGWMLTQKQCLETFDRHTADADIAIVEGVMGLFDGRDGTTEAGSTAQMAKWLGAPVLLVLDCSAVARSAAAIVKGYQEFDKELRLGALLFNKVGGVAHTKWLSDALASAHLTIPLLGGIPKDEGVVLQERYLGLHLPTDPTMPSNLIHNLATLVKTHVDLDQVLELANSATGPDTTITSTAVEVESGNTTNTSHVVAEMVKKIENSSSSSSGEEEVLVLAPESPPPITASPGKHGVSIPEEEEVVVIVEEVERPGSSNQSKKKKKKKSKQQQHRPAPPTIPAASSTAAAAAVISDQIEIEDSAACTPSGDGGNDLDSRTATETAEQLEVTESTVVEKLSSYPLPLLDTSALHSTEHPVRIAVARDAAFCFYYHDNLTLLERAGAELVFFSPLIDPLPPHIAGVYLGGGYPERHAGELAENKLLRAGLKAFADAGGIIYAECGGLLYLSASIQPRGDAPQPTVGVFPFKVVLPPGKYVMGYVEVEVTSACPLFPAGIKARGHVHHASELLEEHHVGGVEVAAEGDGEDGDGSNNENHKVGVGAPWRTGYISHPQIPGAPAAPEGFTRQNVLASYVHLHFGGCPELATALVEKCRAVDMKAVEEAVIESESLAPMLEGSCIQATPPMGSLRLPLGGVPAVRSSPDFHRPNSHRGSRSVDYSAPGRHSMQLHPGQHHPSHQQHQQYNPYAPKIPSPANNLTKVVSSGSLSAHSGYFAHLAALHNGMDRMSQHSESPLAMSPRTNPGSESGAGFYGGGAGQQYAGHNSQHAAHHNQQYGNYMASQSQFYHPRVSEGDIYGNPSNALPPPGMVPLGVGGHPQQPPPPPANMRNNPIALQHYYQQQQQYNSMRYSNNTNPGSSSNYPGNLSDDGSLPRSSSWAQLPHSNSGGNLPDHAGMYVTNPNNNSNQQYSQQQSVFQARQQHAAALGAGAGGGNGGRNSTSSVAEGMNRVSSTGLMNGEHTDLSSIATPLASAFANGSPNFPISSGTPHNWQHGYPPSDKIATLSAGATEIAWALGLGNRVAAVSDSCDFPAEAATKAKAARRMLLSSSTTTATAPGTGPTSAVVSANGSPLKPFGGGSVSAPGSSANLAALATATAAARDRLGVYSSNTSSNTNGSSDQSVVIYRIDDQVLARERPGLVVYEEEEPAVVQIPTSSSSSTSNKQSSFGTSTNNMATNSILSPTSSAPTTPAYSNSTNNIDTTATDFPTAAAHHQQQQANAFGRAVCEAVVAVGLQSACRVVCLRRSTLADVLSSMLVVGEAAGVAEEAARTVDRLRARLRRVGVEAARAALSSSSIYTDSRPKVLILRSLQPLVVEGRWAADMIQLAGGESGSIQSGDAPRELTWTDVLEFAPDVLIIASMRDGSGPRTFHDLCNVAAFPGWWLLPAVKTGAVFVCEEALVRRGGPRLVEGTETIARMVHGDGVSVCCPPRAVLKLSLRPGQRCRPRLLPNYFMAYC